MPYADRECGVVVDETTESRAEEGPRGVGPTRATLRKGQAREWRGVTRGQLAPREGDGELGPRFDGVGDRGESIGLRDTGSAHWRAERTDEDLLGEKWGGTADIFRTSYRVLNKKNHKELEKYKQLNRQTSKQKQFVGNDYTTTVKECVVFFATTTVQQQQKKNNNNNKRWTPYLFLLLLPTNNNKCSQ